MGSEMCIRDSLISELDSNEFLCDDDVLQPQTMDFKTAFKKALENNFGRKNSNKEENENGGSDKK